MWKEDTEMKYVVDKNLLDLAFGSAKPDMVMNDYVYYLKPVGYQFKDDVMTLFEDDIVDYVESCQLDEKGRDVKNDKKLTLTRPFAAVPLTQKMKWEVMYTTQTATGTKSYISENGWVDAHCRLIATAPSRGGGIIALESWKVGRNGEHDWANLPTRISLGTLEKLAAGKVLEIGRTYGTIKSVAFPEAFPFAFIYTDGKLPELIQKAGYKEGFHSEFDKRNLALNPDEALKLWEMLSWQFAEKLVPQPRQIEE